MNFVDEINLVTAGNRLILNVFQNFPGIFHLGSGGGIDFNEIRIVTVGNSPATFTFTARMRGYALFAVKAFCQNSGDCGLTHASGSGKKIGMMKPARIQSVYQRCQNMLLSDHVLK